MINLYFHNGSLNHGCEAIVRATKKIINLNMNLFSRNSASDIKYRLNEIVTVKDDIKRVNISSIEHYSAAIYHKIFHNDYLFTKYSRKAFFDCIKKDDICLSIGGDNYCYAGKDILGYYNKIIHKRGAKAVLWGCSFEPSDLNTAIARDLATYDMIIARESYSYDVLKSVNPNTFLIPDPAFLLDRRLLPLPEKFTIRNTVGINVSPLIINCENHTGVTKDNYDELIKYILNHTDMNIALIPHVVETGNDDRDPLMFYYEKYKSTGRVVFIEDCNAMELKGYISRCRFFVGARTHATIAAYSTFVPTLVVGYSVKARGIARDIFGDEANYVCPVQSLKHNNDLLNRFIWLVDNEASIKAHLRSFIPNYINRAFEAGELVRCMK